MCVGEPLVLPCIAEVLQIKNFACRAAGNGALNYDKKYDRFRQSCSRDELNEHIG